MRAVVLTTVLPSGRRTGGELVTQGMVEALRAAGWDVSVVGYARPDGSPPGEGEVVAGRRPIETSSAGLRGPGWMARALVTWAPYSVAKYASRSYVAVARREVARRADAVIADHAQVAFAVRALGVRPVFVAHNVEGDAYEGLVEAASGIRRRLHRREARLISAEEAQLARDARQVWTLTEDDAARFHSIAPDAKVRALPVPSQLVAPAAGEPARDIALIGNWTWPPNALGLDWFAREVLPRLPHDARVDVAGAGAEAFAGRDPRLSVRGVVADAAGFIATARVAAVPAVAGTGVQVKTLDVIACGVPVVATGTGVRGLGAPPASVTVAREAGAFAAALMVRRGREERDRLRAAAVAWSRARHERFVAQVKQLLAELS